MNFTNIICIYPIFESIKNYIEIQLKKFNKESIVWLKTLCIISCLNKQISHTANKHNFILIDNETIRRVLRNIVVIDDFQFFLKRTDFALNKFISLNFSKRIKNNRGTDNYRKKFFDRFFTNKNTNIYTVNFFIYYLNFTYKTLLFRKCDMFMYKLGDVYGNDEEALERFFKEDIDTYIVSILTGKNVKKINSTIYIRYITY